MKAQKKNGGSSSSRISDARFASFETDPRFRLPSKKYSKTIVDKRFSSMLEDEDFTATAKVDRYGRKIKSDSTKKSLQRLYQMEEEGGDGDGEAGDVEEDDVDDDELVQRELRAAHEKYMLQNHDPARCGGFSSSESDSEEEEEEKVDEEDGGADVVSEGYMQRFQDEQADVEGGEITNRIAIVNLDWDHVKSIDLMALFSSFIPPSSGRILNISIYPSEFGKERMHQEEIEGPPKALFKNASKEADSSDDSSDGDSDSDSDSASRDEKIKKDLVEEGDDQDFDGDALRSYQLDRLRYYYAVMVCSSPEAAQQIYEATDGTEYQTSSNVIDLRFIPDDVTFDDEPRDECSKVPDSYKPVEFVTNALQSSKVKLTWDMHPEEASRRESIKKAFSGSRAELGENDLRAYLASDSEGEEDDWGGIEDSEGETGEAKVSKKELARRKMREALGITDEPAPRSSKNGPVGEMQITFAPALTDSKPTGPDATESTIDKYKRKERERKERKRQSAKAKRGASNGDGDDKGKVAEERSGDAEEDAGFDDPFFTTEDAAPAPKTSIRKEERRKKREARQAAEAELAKEKAHLSQIMGERGDEDWAEHLDHFDMKEITRAEKRGGKKKKKEGVDGGDVQEGFEMDVGDDRFKAVFDNHEFAIDPSNARFKPTGGMKKLLEEVRKKRRAGGEEGGGRSKRAKK